MLTHIPNNHQGVSLLDSEAHTVVFYDLSSEVKKLVHNTIGCFIGFMKWIALKMNITKLRKFLLYFQKKKNVHKVTYTSFVTKWVENVLKARINELLGSYHVLSLWHLASIQERVNETINKKNG